MRKSAAALKNTRGKTSAKKSMTYTNLTIATGSTGAAGKKSSITIVGPKSVDAEQEEGEDCSKYMKRKKSMQ